ncbi:MAG: D-cysteine desulfhydrase family protein [candidate division WOR-3 bacterium]|nr:D-cysteine desulfhydrase family protein [candidate division WOR-3 bacterium]
MLKPLKLTNKPTPIEKYEFDNFTIHIKRDDLNGLIDSGNKARKLEYLLADALNKKCDTIITAGYINSNHCRITAYFCRRLGLKPILILNCLRKRRKIEKEGNLLLDYLFGAEIHFLDDKEYKEKEIYVDELMKRLIKKGFNPYYIPTGGSNEIGILGYRDCFLEMVNYLKENKIDGIFCAVGSGGTYAGLLYGKLISNLDIPIYGILVDETIDYFKIKIRDILSKLNCLVEEKEFNLIDGYIGKGYGIPYKEEIEIVKEWAKRGIIFDLTYTGKAFYGMLKESRKRDFKNPLFIHTGGIFSIFAHKDYLK